MDFLPCKSSMASSRQIIGLSLIVGLLGATTSVAIQVLEVDHNATIRTSKSSNISALSRFDLVGAFKKVPESGDDTSCRISTINITRIIQGISVNETRIPHSLISVDGDKCGPKGSNSTDKELVIEDYVQVVPGDFLASLKSQADADRHVFVSFMYRTLARTAYENVSRIIQAFHQRNDSEVFVGYERWSDWKCGVNRTIRVPRHTFFLFIRSTRAKVNLQGVIKGSYTVPASKQFLLTFSKSQPWPCAYIALRNTKNDDEKPSDGGQAGNNLPSPVDQFECFPGSATLLGSTGSRIRMKNLNIEEQILSPLMESPRSVANSKILFYTHHVSRGLFHFLKLQTESNNSITLSPGHYIYTNFGLVAAKDVKVGDMLFRFVEGLFSEEAVTSILGVKEEGLYNPQSDIGSLMVNDFAVSCYTTALNPSIAHSLVASIGHLVQSLPQESELQSMRSLSGLFSSEAWWRFL